MSNVKPDTGRWLKDRRRGDIREVLGSTLGQETGYPYAFLSHLKPIAAKYLKLGFYAISNALFTNHPTEQLCIITAL